jgi:hypothetical protein
VRKKIVSKCSTYEDLKGIADKEHDNDVQELIFDRIKDLRYDISGMPDARKACFNSLIEHVGQPALFKNLKHCCPVKSPLISKKPNNDNGLRSIFCAVDLKFLGRHGGVSASP